MNEPRGRSRRLAQAAVTRGGWYGGRALSNDERRDAEKRWVDRSYEHRADESRQCGGCAYFAATGSDFGICVNPASPLDGSITFEHGGCTAHALVRTVDPLAARAAELDEAANDGGPHLVGFGRVLAEMEAAGLLTITPDPEPTPQELDEMDDQAASNFI